MSWYRTALMWLCIFGFHRNRLVSVHGLFGKRYRCDRCGVYSA
jgi:hypothetical protein